MADLTAELIANSQRFLRLNSHRKELFGFTPITAEIPTFFDGVTDPSAILIVFKVQGWLHGCKGNYERQSATATELFNLTIFPYIVDLGFTEHRVHIGQFEGNPREYARLEICTHRCLIQRLPPQA